MDTTSLGGDKPYPSAGVIWGKIERVTAGEIQGQREGQWAKERKCTTGSTCVYACAFKICVVEKKDSSTFVSLLFNFFLKKIPTHISNDRCVVELYTVAEVYFQASNLEKHIRKTYQIIPSS